MNCAQAQKLIKPFLDHNLPDHELSQFLDHIKTCPDCYDELGIYLAIGETLKNDKDSDEPEDYDFRTRLKREIESAESELRFHRSQAWISRGLLLVAVLLLGLLIYTGVYQWEHPELPAWETEGLSEALTEKGEAVAETAEAVAETAVAASETEETAAGAGETATEKREAVPKTEDTPAEADETVTEKVKAAAVSGETVPTKETEN